MVARKASEVERFLAKPDPQFAVILIYGPDRGLVSERAEKFAKSTNIDLNDPFSTIRLDMEDVAADPARLASEAHTISMFGDKRLIWIKGQTQKNISAALDPVLQEPATDSYILIEGGDLKKSAPLRSRIEKAKQAIALPCYQDQGAALDQIISEEVEAAGLTIDPDARAFLKQNLGGDRLASRGEVVKLCLYALEKGTIQLDDIKAIVGDASAFALDEIVDAVSTGNVKAMEALFIRLLARGIAVYQIIAALQRHFQALLQQAAKMESGGQSAGSLVASMRPPVNFQRKDAMIRALSIWRRPALLRALSRLEDISLQSRQQADMAEQLTSMTLLALTIEAARSRR